MLNPKISIITVSFNSAKTISDTIESVLSQTYPDIEYLVLDGSSSDGTVELVNSYGNRISKFISEPDKGIYDAINKGIRLATGNIIGILHSDDFFYSNNVIEKVAASFNEYEIDAVFGDARFVDPINTSKVVRYYSSKLFSIAKFKFGYMPAHPSFYVKRELFEKLGYYKTDYKIAADFELLVRFLYINQIKCKYLEIPFLSMRMGGVSNKSIFSKYTLNKEIVRACKENGIKTNYFLIYSKYFSKLFEFKVNKND
ncbi:MAG: glycosyltransferase family 2 protein [Bacteroidales bacterium]|jgi:glycosyltransferase involved in cell wall biosynthesis